MRTLNSHFCLFKMRILKGRFSRRVRIEIRIGRSIMEHINDLLLDIELLTALILERDALDDQNFLGKKNIKELVSIKYYITQINVNGIQDYNSEKVLDHLQIIKKKLRELKFYPLKYKKIIEEVKVKVQQCIDNH